MRRTLLALALSACSTPSVVVWTQTYDPPASGFGSSNGLRVVVDGPRRIDCADRLEVELGVELLAHRTVRGHGRFAVWSTSSPPGEYQYGQPWVLDADVGEPSAEVLVVDPVDSISLDVPLTCDASGETWITTTADDQDGTYVPVLTSTTGVVD